MKSIDNFRLDGKVAMVTGGGRGLGAKIAEGFAGAGATVVITDIDSESATAQAEELSKQGATALAFQHDVTNEARWNEVIASVIKQAGGYDILVNNAGIEVVELLENCSFETFKRVQATNVDGVFLGMKHSILAMKPGGSAGKGGSIINMSSVAGMLGFSAVSAYCASKGAVRLMSKAAAKECGDLDYGIRVNSIHPGLILTEMGSNLLKGYVRIGLAENEDAAAETFAAIHPLGFGQPEDIANAAIYLASPASRWVTGTEQIVDGGWQA